MQALAHPRPLAAPVSAPTKRRRRARQRRWLLRSLSGTATLEALGNSVAVSRRFGIAAVAGAAPPAHPCCRVALHAHTTYSDGLGSVPQVIDGARRAGARVLILADHDTLQPLRDGWEGYHDGVLVLVGTEIRTDAGYLLALGLPGDFRPHGTAREVVGQVNRAGGLAFAALSAHPTVPWEDWSIPGLAGLEVANLHSLSRQAASLPALPAFGALLALRRSAAYAMLTPRPRRELDLWDRLAGEKRMVGLASADAHGHVRVGRRPLCIPSYEDSFRLVQTHALPTEPLSGNPDRDRKLVLDSLREGRCRLVLREPEAAEGFRFGYRSAAGDAIEGEEAAWHADGRIEAASPSARTRFRLFCDGQLIGAAEGEAVTFRCPYPGAYRLEADRYAARSGGLLLGIRPWVYTNPVYLR
jgi:hypothetical protein